MGLLHSLRRQISAASGPLSWTKEVAHKSKAASKQMTDGLGLLILNFVMACKFRGAQAGGWPLHPAGQTKVMVDHDVVE